MWYNFNHWLSIVITVSTKMSPNSNRIASGPTSTRTNANDNFTGWANNNKNNQLKDKNKKDQNDKTKSNSKEPESYPGNTKIKVSLDWLLTSEIVTTQYQTWLKLQANTLSRRVTLTASTLFTTTKWWGKLITSWNHMIHYNLLMSII